MFTYFSIFLIMGMISFAFYIQQKFKGESVKSVFAKTLTSTCFVCAGFSTALTFIAHTSKLRESLSLSMVNSESSYISLPLLLCIGLLCGLLGDIWLALKNTYKANKSTFMMAGFLLFALGHLFYILSIFLGFTAGKDSSTLLLKLLSGLILGAILGLIISLVGGKIGLKYGHFRKAVKIYMMILCGMVGVMTSFYLGSPSSFSFALLMAAILFAVSDLLLGFLYFSQVHSKKLMTFLNLFTYYVAQFLIAASMLFLANPS